LEEVGVVAVEIGAERSGNDEFDVVTICVCGVEDSVERVSWTG
jgi:hypothetical protein